ncbi:MAG: XRE family transcriptional regulator [Polycyclovorans sp.]|jgi:predicted XRE-type DNA-binding protein|uniref:XRE family transcriptional regulator n=1 Tax=Hwanghaeella sp. 1Z406 TaxID=3402811 RepID=UPI000C38A1B7|nr:XRE family transcriptional regulator [Rhodospirillales bacterium]MAY26046.1 XRE family transcriptional regulator [Polycyclovorans sp.]|tara:strand:- start:85 stop:453 length:369 start_codon:yes stop_codon:yes gene_type:complete|eukprot:NODE_13980_length_427_cov_0.813333_g13957_i0.p2 GENE.NODE_13980_length_427_cov_0.813333_g13957_i0~~NODE_13980_length_427_cov_0.813333_g13957_i0.p2  ORF type:complete len:123 (-),score=24.37 NODE_13980_length_427_cov_0.813333_g13957_i0:11-379(-)
MGRSLNEVIAALPVEEQAAIDVRYQALKQEVEGLRELREITGKAQADIATALNIKQPSVSKIENQADMYLSTLRSYVEAVGGKLELMVKLPKRPAMRIHHLGDIAPTVRAPKPIRAAKQHHG